MLDDQHRPLDRRGSPVAVGVLALIAAGLSVVIYGMQGQWPADGDGWGVVVFVIIATSLMGHRWRETHGTALSGEAQ